MADVEDVIGALADYIGGVLYPSGADTAIASPVASVVTLVVKGWPQKAELDAYLKAGKAQVSVRHNTTRANTTRQMGQDELEWVELKTPSYGLSRVGENITVAGAAPNPFHTQNIVVFVDGGAVVYQPAEGEDSSTVAAGLAALIPDAVAVLNVLNIPSPHLIGPLRVGVTGTAFAEVRRQEEVFQVSVWAPSPEARQALSVVIDGSLAALTFLDLGPDGEVGRIRYTSTQVVDFEQMQGVYRRDLNYSVEYGTITTEVQTQITTIIQTLEDPDGVEIARNEY